jgi:ABC-type glutathione transport system ATPase component
MSSALEKLSVKIILESGLVQQDTKGNPGWERIKHFTTKYLSADSEKAQVETYRQALRDAMQALSVSMDDRKRAGETHLNLQQDLLIYVAFSISEQPSQSAAPRKKIVAKRPPKVSQYYVKREREWKFMVDSIADSTNPGQKILAITGVGGCGKTQLVSYFLNEKEGL